MSKKMPFEEFYGLVLSSIELFFREGVHPLSRVDENSSQQEQYALAYAQGWCDAFNQIETDLSNLAEIIGGTNGRQPECGR